jgi:phosphoribosylamine-glycine ligase
MSKPVNIAIKDRGIELRPLDTKDSHDQLVSALKDVDIFVSAIGPREQLEQIPLVTAAKEAGVKLFVPCAFITSMPVGVHVIRDQKEEVYNHIKRLHMPYVIIDVGWW